VYTNYDLGGSIPSELGLLSNLGESFSPSCPSTVLLHSHMHYFSITDLQNGSFFRILAFLDRSRLRSMIWMSLVSQFSGNFCRSVFGVLIANKQWQNYSHSSVVRFLSGEAYVNFGGNGAALKGSLMTEIGLLSNLGTCFCTKIWVFFS
jgi:hypothetical protein